MAVRRGELGDLTLAGDDLGCLLEDLTHPIEPDPLGSFLEQLLLEWRGKVEACRELERELRRPGIRDVDIAPRQLDETSEEHERPLRHSRCRRIREIVVRLDQRRPEAPTLGGLDNPEAIATLDDDIEPPVREAVQHLGDGGARPYALRLALVAEKEAELLRLLEAFADQLAVSRLEDVERDPLRRQEDNPQREHADLVHGGRLRRGLTPGPYRDDSESVQVRAGIDLVDVAEVDEAVDRWGDRYLARVFTGSELAVGEGDRFFYRNDPVLRLIERLYGITYRKTLADLIQLNTDTTVQPNVFTTTG